MYRKTLLPLTLVFGLLFAAAAVQAAPVRIPTIGTPAFAFDAPSGWNVLYDDFGNLRLSADDKSSFVLLTIISEPNLANMSLDAVAAAVMKSAGAAPFSSTSPATIGGLAGTSYFSQITAPNGASIGVTVEIVRLDATHAGGLAILKTANMTPGQTASLDALVAQVKLEGAR
jgi:hypothetical protein